MRRFVASWWWLHATTVLSHVAPFAVAPTLFVPPLVALAGSAVLSQWPSASGCALTCASTDVPGGARTCVDDGWSSRTGAASCSPRFCLPVSQLSWPAARIARDPRARPSRAIARAELVSYGLALAVAAWGVRVRGAGDPRRPRRHSDPRARGGLDGYRIAQVEDLHIGNHDRRRVGSSGRAGLNPALSPISSP